MSMASVKRNGNSRFALVRPALATTCAGISRQYRMVSVAIGNLGLRVSRQKALHAAEPGHSDLQRQAEPRRGRMGARFELVIRQLRQPDDAPIIAEIVAHQLRKPVDAE